MTIETGRVIAVLACVLLGGAALLAHGCAGTSKVRHGDTIDVSGYPKDIQAAYEVFSVRCSRCHTLARPLNARIHDAQHWQRYVARMRRNPSSGITAANSEIILRFLLYYMHQQDQAESDVQEEPVPDAPPTRSAVHSAEPSSIANPDESAVQPVEVAPAPSEPATAPERTP